MLALESRSATLFVPDVAMPWIVVALVHCAIWPLVGVPTFDTLPPPDGVAQVPSPRRNVLTDGVPVTGLAAMLVTVLMTVPLVGSVSAVLAVAVNVWVNAPAYVTAPPRVRVLVLALATPVPP